MEAVIKIKMSEFTSELIDSIKRIVADKEHVEITISVRDKESKPFLFEETQEEYAQNLREAIENVEGNRNLVSFTLEEFEKFSESLARK